MVQINVTGPTLADLQLELQQLMIKNEQLTLALKESEGCPLNVKNDLVTENWDLKHTISRIRYGKPVRTNEDREAINRLVTENQELRAQVGSLRYRCVQPSASVIHTHPVWENIKTFFFFLNIRLLLLMLFVTVCYIT